MSARCLALNPFPVDDYQPVVSDLSSIRIIMIVQILPCPRTFLDGLFRDELGWFVDQRSKTFQRLKSAKVRVPYMRKILTRFLYPIAFHQLLVMEPPRRRAPLGTPNEHLRNSARRCYS